VKILLEQSRIDLRHLHGRVRFRGFVERHDDLTDVVEQPPDADEIGKSKLIAWFRRGRLGSMVCRKRHHFSCTTETKHADSDRSKTG
tara:strand:+ start:320 stop:580 length:261 start_codon:yes stop_codon:yes gene_type:complete